MNIQNYYTTLLPHTFAADYDCSAYGAGAYNEGQVCDTTTGTDSGTAGGGLVNTGVHVFLPILVGAILVVTAVVLFVRRPKKQAAK